MILLLHRLLSLVGSVDDALLLEQLEDAWDDQSRFVLTECHGAEVALQAVKGRLFILLLLEENLVKFGVSQPSFRLSLVLLDRE